ncbi:MAG: hypothetical protein Q9221_002379 [Calogaya cf. arnoldii]
MFLCTNLQSQVHHKSDHQVKRGPGPIKRADKRASEGNALPSSSATATPNQALQRIIESEVMPEATDNPAKLNADNERQPEALVAPSSPVQLSPQRKIFTKEMVTVEVGPEKVSFGFHKGLNCCLSPFFNAAFNGSFKEAATQTVHLKDDDPEDFNIVHNWFYTGNLTRASNEEDHPLFFAPEILNTYVLADKLGIPRLCDAVINLISGSARDLTFMSSNLLLEIYERTNPNDRLRRLIIAIILHNPLYNLDMITVHHHEEFTNCPELLMDFLTGMRAIYAQGDFKVDPIKLCHFHRHKEGEPCLWAGLSVPTLPLR